MDLIAAYHPTDDFEFHLPSPDYGALLSLCLVCKQWTHHARYLLYFRIRLERGGQMTRLVNGLQSQPGNGRFTRILEVTPPSEDPYWPSTIPYTLPRYFPGLEFLQLTGMNVVDLYPHFPKSMSLFKHLRAIQINASEISLCHALRLTFAVPPIQHITFYSIPSSLAGVSFFGRPPISISSVSFVLDMHSDLVRMLRVFEPCAPRLTRLHLLVFVQSGGVSPVPADFPGYARALGEFLKSAPALHEIRVSMYCSMVHNLDFRHQSRLRILDIYCMHDGPDIPNFDESKHEAELTLRTLYTVSSADLALICIAWEPIYRQIEDEMTPVCTQFNKDLLRRFAATSRFGTLSTLRSFIIAEPSDNRLVTGPVTVLSEEDTLRAISFSQAMSPFPTRMTGISFPDVRLDAPVNAEADVIRDPRTTWQSWLAASEEDLTDNDLQM
ncbi:hypothetical protein EIP91_004729 [Steccherinum ochraceum]|uniref:F-box domain-containing protein n=1 Tax=Steccherinum ochraceum TaxID=92696 RepID=A0A4R0R8A3_9APHY|nr:hypothetical protein EIP91_004729 [Steccherinum ochraceum]